MASWSLGSACAGNGATRVQTEDGEQPHKLLKEDRSDEFFRDLVMWSTECNESFHVRIFLKEFVCQTLHTLFGIFSVPVLYLIYGSKAALINRCFWPGTYNKPFFASFVVLSLLVTTALLIKVFWTPPENVETEFKFLFVLLVMRSVTISSKYANMTTGAWMDLNQREMPDTIIVALLIGSSWHIIPKVTMETYAEISCVGILGTRWQRQRLAPRFIPWPQDMEELSTLRHRVDATTKRLLMTPTGQIAKRSLWKGQPRRVVVKKFAEEEEERAPSNEVMPQTSTPGGSSRNRRTSPLPAPDGKKHIHHYRLQPQGSDGGPAATLDKDDEAFVAAAGNGVPVPVEELFRFFLRSVLRSEVLSAPTKVIMWIRQLCALAVGTVPLVIRLVRCRHRLHEISTQWLIFELLLAVPQALMFSLNLSFVEIAARDMWRRRALLRSCSALLTLSRELRHGCPIEVDQLPVLDLCDPRSIEAWRKLRQLCLDWGRFFYERIQIFMGSYCLFTLLCSVDVFLSLTVTQYEESFPITMHKLILFYTLFLTVGAAIMFMAFFGQDVNDSTYHHIALLSRQRMILVADQNIQLAEAMQEGIAGCPDPNVEQATLQIESLCEDLKAYHDARPVRLLGMYCGYSLVSALYFVPATMLVRTATFCSDGDTAWKCRSI